MLYTTNITKVQNKSGIQKAALSARFSAKWTGNASLWGHKRSQSVATALVEKRLLAPAARRPRAARSTVQRMREGRGRCVRRVAGRCAEDGGEDERREGEPLTPPPSLGVWDCPTVAESPSLSTASVACVPSASRGGSRRWSAGAVKKRRRMWGCVPGEVSG